MKYLSIILSLFLIGCSSSDDPDESNTNNNNNSGSSGAPVISQITVSLTDRYAGDQIEVSAIVTDSENDIVSYEWSFSGGDFEETSQTSVNWNSPSTAGSYTITLTVKDAEDNSTSKTEEVLLELRPLTFQKNIGGNYFRLYSNSGLHIVDDAIYMYVSQPSGESSSSMQLVKLDLFGTQIWSREITTREDSPLGVGYFELTADGNFLLNTEFGVAKVNLEGEILWTYNDAVGGFIQLDNGNYYFTTYIEGEDVSGFYIFSPDGVVIANGPNDEEIDFLPIYGSGKGPDADTYFIISSYSTPSSEPNARMVLINGSGDYVSEFALPYRIFQGAFMFQESDGTYTIFFNTEDASNQGTITRVNMDSEGNVNNQNIYTNSDFMSAISVSQAQDGGYFVVGAIGSSSAAAKSLFFKTNMDGSQSWQSEYGNRSDKMDFASKVQITPSGRVLISGSEYIVDATGTFVRIYLHKYNSDGSL